MTTFPAAGHHGFGKVLRFGGRDSRPQFWFYVLWLFLAQQLLGALLAIGLISSGIGEPFQAGTSGGLDPAKLFNFFFGGAIAVGVLLVALVAAAAVRRLHDSDLSGAWGLFPIPFLSIGIVVIMRVFGSDDASPMRYFTALLVNNLVYLVTLVALVILLCRPSTPGPNRFGAPSEP